MINKEAVEDRFRKGQRVKFLDEQGREIRGIIKRLNKETVTVVFRTQEMRRIEYQFLELVK
jgi:lauroyl/myristoyl acyltransferase